MEGGRVTGWPEAVREYEQVLPVSSDEVRVITRKEWWVERRLSDAAIADLIEMVRRFYWQRNELLRLSTAYPAVMKEKLEKDWEARK